MNVQTEEPPIARGGDLIADKYLVERVVGEGGMGVVVVAMHQELGERVALKFLRKSAQANPEIVARFRNEARAAARLKSHHIARVLDVGQHGDCPFMVMEYLDGEDLSKRIKHGPLPIEDAVEFAIQACEGLAEAHAREIVHRDIKPENLFLVEHHGIKTVKILDFGISKAALSGPANNFQTSSIMGSPVYMSPEQLRSTRNVDLRADIWSLGAVIFELLTGETPFDSTVTLTELIAFIALSPPRDLRVFRPDLPPDLVAVVMKCLEKEQTARWRNTAELACALLPWAPKRAYTVAERAVTMVKTAGLPSSSTEMKVPSYRPPSLSHATGPNVASGHAKTELLGASKPPGESFSKRPTMSPSDTSGALRSTSSPVSGPTSAGPPRSNSLMFAAVVGAIAITLGVVAFIKFKPAPVPAAAAAVPPPAAAPAQAETIDVVLRAEPRETRFVIDDGQPLENPYVGKVPRDGATHVIHARAPGYKEKTREVTFDTNVTIGLLLSKDGKPAAK